MTEPIAKVLGFDVYTLASYTTPYFFIKELGSTNHTMTLRQLKGVIRRAIKAGKLQAREVES